VDEIVRLDTGVREGDEVSVFYDPMIAKVVAWGADREEAARRMQEALSETAILGVKTNLAFLERVVRHPAYLQGATDTGFIERHRADLIPASGEAPLEALVAAAARVFLDERTTAASLSPSPWNDTGGWRLNQAAVRRMEFRLSPEKTTHVDAQMHPGHAMITVAGKRHRVALGPCEGERLQIALDDETYFAHVYRLDDALSVVAPQGRFNFELVDPFHYEPADVLPDARLTSLMPGRVVKLLASKGDQVKKGQSLLILEAMKMEHTIVSPRDGVIVRVAFAENDLVPADAVLFAFDE
jgi:3-methylcrotonyl-CoA carboxylase alpha subunit